jgi:hypothetical protein
MYQTPFIDFSVSVPLHHKIKVPQPLCWRPYHLLIILLEIGRCERDPQVERKRNYLHVLISLMDLAVTKYFVACYSIHLQISHYYSELCELLQ